jgi:hypothetical protein
MVVAKIMERLAVNKQGSQKFLMDSFNVKNLNKIEGINKYRVDVSNWFEALKSLGAEAKINTVWGTIR